MAPRKVIIDTDPGVDDVLALLLALSSPELHLLAITITFGNTHARTAHSNLLKVYAQLAREIEGDESGEAGRRFGGLVKGESEGGKTVLALGAEGPIGGERDLAAYFHGQDGLSNISTTHPHFTPPPHIPGSVHAHLDVSDKPAHEVMLEVLGREERGSVSVIALGPMSNCALALQKDPETFSRVGEVIWMGGALDVPGNTSPTAEFNSFADPYAIQAILDAVEKGFFPLTMAPLDITTPHTIPFDQLIHDANSHPTKQLTPLRDFTSAMLGRVRGLMKSFGLEDAMEQHDAVAVWYAIGTAGVGVEELVGGEGVEGWATQERVFKVERKGELTRGMCVVDRRGGGEEITPRTKSSIANGANEDTAVTKSERKGYARVIVKTPGKKVLEELMLSRVFGN